MNGPRRRGRPRLRARIAAGFGAAGLFLAALMGVITFEISQVHLLSERESTAAHLAAAAADAIGPGVEAGKDAASLVGGLSVPANSVFFVTTGSGWVSSPANTPVTVVPDALRSSVLAGHTIRSHYRPFGSPTLVVAGVALRPGQGVILVTRVPGLDQDLSTFRVTLLGVAAGTALVGAAIGWWVGGLSLRPLRAAADAAAAIAAGRLDTRLPELPDRDLGRVAVSFNAMVDTLERRIARDARFASDVSHELRSPLTALSTSAQLLAARRDQLSERDRTLVDVLVGQLDRFQRLIEDLLEMSRADGSPDLALEDTRVGDLVAHAVANSEPELPVVIEPSAAERHALVDKRRFERVIANLLDNARNHGGGAVKVSVAGRDGTVHITIDDAGPGVPDAERERIFERFARGSGARQSGARGVGLGLSLVDEHVRLHGGTVWVESRPGGGARFVVELPATS